jgi:TrmH family RNA methyltransferase
MRPLSARNPRVQRLARLVRRSGERAEQRALVVEGPVLASAALDAGLGLRDLFVDEAALDRPLVSAVVDRVAPVIEPWCLPTGTLDRVGEAVSSQGLVAVFDQPEPVWPSSATTDLVLVLDGVADPGNAGTLVRAATAAGAGAVVFVGGVDPTSPKVVRSTAGALFAVDVLRAAPGAEAAARLRSNGFRLVAAAVRGGDPYDRVDLTGPVALVVGNEAHGLDPGVREAVDVTVTIPMPGPTESLNVAMAGTVLCFEVLRQRRNAT